MAVLPSRLQSILYARLKEYNCVSDQLPERLAKYGGVAICSGGSYKSLCDWAYLDVSLFKADFTSPCTSWPLMFEITNAPACYLADGPYLRTTDRYNGYPVYAQITRLELQKDKCGLERCITDRDLMTHLLSTTQHFGDQQLRAGERLLVRQQNAWVVQSVSAYRGFSQKTGSCGFHVIHVPDDSSFSATCFAGMPLKGEKPFMEDCEAKLTKCTIGPDAFHANSQFRFTFGSRRCVRPTVFPGTKYTPHVTQNQEFHTDGPVWRDAAAMWTADGEKVDWRSDNFRLSYLTTLSVRELQECCQARSLPIKKADSDEDLDQSELAELLFQYIETAPELPLPVPDSLLQNLSALMAFFPNTALGVPCSLRPGSRGWPSLKLGIPIGCAVLFRFDFIHHGWKCVREGGQTDSSLPVHFRAHFYLFSNNLPTLPMYNFEALLEYLSVLSIDSMDDATQLLMLECLQTFVPYLHPHKKLSKELKPLNQVASSRGYKLFESQQALEEHCAQMCE